jgi:hypothetical protein
MTYQHPNKDPNLNNLHHAMQYNANGEPIVRVSLTGSINGIRSHALVGVLDTADLAV